MNAYELADKLENYYDSDYDEIVNMLRQQADRIAELEKQLQESAMQNISITAQADDHYARVKELEKQSEVMAYIYQDPDTLQPALKFANPTNYWATVISTPDIPLYTTPQTKPLSDEEIHYIRYKIEVKEGWELNFARAIETKVRGEK